MFKTYSKISESFNFNLPSENVNYRKESFYFFGKKNNFVLFTRKKKRKPKQSCCKRIIFKIKKLKIKILVLVHCSKFDQSFILYQTKYIFWSEKSFNQKNPSSKNIQVISFDKK